MLYRIFCVNVKGSTKMFVRILLDQSGLVLIGRIRNRNWFWTAFIHSHTSYYYTWNYWYWFYKSVTGTTDLLAQFHSIFSFLTAFVWHF